MSCRLVVLLPLVMVGASCSPTDFWADAVNRRSGEPPVVQVSKQDRKLQEASDEARANLPQFIQTLKAPRSEQSHFAIKAVWRAGDRVEALWLSNVTYDGRRFHGRLANTPCHATNELSYGDRLSVDADQVEDWMWVEGNRLRGGFTVRVLRDRLSRGDRERLDRESPFTWN